MSISTSPTPPLLLTKRLNAFLHAHQSPLLPTLLLTTSHGRLLAHASPVPVAQLRTHATVAASLLALHEGRSASVRVNGGTVVIRRLECGLLFVCTGDLLSPSPSNASANTNTKASARATEEDEAGDEVERMRRGAGELASWLDERLGTLRVPEGMNL